MPTGVEFRFTAVRIARSYPKITGHVRNMADGRVELVAEGPSQDLGRLVAQIRADMGANVRSVDAQRSAPTGEFSQFVIAY